MSRLIGFGSTNQSVGEAICMFPRGWMVDGSYSTSGGGQSTLYFSAGQIMAAPWLQFGRFVMATHAKLGPAAGMVDPPWSATAPVGVEVYNLAYGLSLRTPDYPLMLVGTVFEIAAQIIALINAQEELYIRLGETSGSDIVRQETLDQRSFWEQLTALVARAGKEMFLRPVIEDKTLIIYVDIKDRIGVDTGFLLHDDDTNGRANIQLVDARIDGKIRNRLIGIGSQSANNGRLQSEPQRTQASIDIFRLRSDVKQYSNVVDETTLISNTQNDVAYTSWPRIIFRLNILDVEETFQNTRPGNSFILHVAKNLYLPGGMQSWRGVARLMAMAYDEASETVSAQMEAVYYGNA